MIRKLLVENRHIQLQLLLIQFLSVASADTDINLSSTSYAVDIAEENSTQSAAKNQIAGKCAAAAFFALI